MVRRGGDPDQVRASVHAAPFRRRGRRPSLAIAGTLQAVRHTGFHVRARRRARSDMHPPALQRGQHGQRSAQSPSPPSVTVTHPGVRFRDTGLIAITESGSQADPSVSTRRYWLACGFARRRCN